MLLHHLRIHCSLLLSLLNCLSCMIDRLLGQRRKKIKNCLPELETGGGILGLLAEAQIDPDARGETVEPEKYVHLANLLAEGGCWADQ